MRGLLIGSLVLSLAAALFAAVPAAAATGATYRTLQVGEVLHVGDRLVSGNGRYHAAVLSSGRLVLKSDGGRTLWSAPRGGGTSARVSTSGQVVLAKGARDMWRSATRGSGRHDALAVLNSGALALSAGSHTVWASNVPNRCRGAGKSVVVDISAQRVRMCQGDQQVGTSPVTTGASAYGDGTPTGTWSVYAKVRNTTLYPAAGGAYPVKFWMPYSGAYGFHDSPWQHFAYGSSLYRTRGSHGCVHVPGAVMAWLFSWAAVGTRVVIHG